MKKLKVIGIFVFIVFLILAGLQVDDDLDNAPLELVKKFEEQEISISNAYLYLNGISAAENDDVFELGKLKLKEHLVIDEIAEVISSSFEYEVYSDERKLVTPWEDADLYCKLRDNGCLEKIIGAKNLWEVEIDFRKTIIQRYNKYLKYTDFRMMTKPTVYEIYPEYSYISYGNRLRILEELTIAAQESPSQAIGNLLADISMLRQQLVVADTEIHKLVFITMISNNLDIIAYINYAYKAHVDLDISLLSIEERNFEVPIVRSYVFMNNMIISADRSPELFEMGGEAWPWVVRMVYKPHMILNSIFKLQQELIDFSKMDLVDFANSPLSKKGDYYEDVNLRNIFGSTLVKIAIESQETQYGFISRINDLNCKIALVNYFGSNNKQVLINPYYPTNKVILSSGKKHCLEGPNKDERNLRCIQVEI